MEFFLEIDLTSCD